MQVVILKQPLYGTITWNGVNFIYNSYTDQKYNDYYIYSLTQNGKTNVFTKYVNQDNTAPIANNVFLTAGAFGTNIININSLASDTTNPFYEFKIESVTGALYGSVSTDGENIYYTSNTFDNVENLTYTITDKEYKSTGTLTLSVVNGIVLDTYPKGLGLLYVLKNRLDSIKPLSSQWNSVINILSTYSPSWDSVDVVRYDYTSDVVTFFSPSWTNSYNARPELNNFITSLNANSAYWNLDVVDGTILYDVSHPKSQIWNTVYSILQSNSAEWASTITRFDLLSVELNTQIQKYNDFSQIVNDNKDTLWDTTELNNISAAYFNFWDGMLFNIKQNYWDNGIYNLNELSSSLSAYTEIFDNLYTLISSNSAEHWDNTLLNTISSNYFNLWDNVFLIISTHNSNWNTVNNEVHPLSASIEEKTLYFDDLYNVITANVGYTWSSINVDYLNKYNLSYSTLSTLSSYWFIEDIFSEKFQKYDSYHQTFTENITSKWIPDTLNNILTSDSVKWDTTYNTLSSLSSGWFFDDSRKSLNFYNNLTSNSAKLTDEYNLINLSSNNWNTFNNISSISARYLSGNFSTPLTVNDLTVNNNLSTSGTVTILGNVKKYDTTIVTTSTFTIYNESTNDALIVDKIGGYGLVATFKDPLSSNILFVDSDFSVGINTTYDATETLTVSGNISASGYMYPYIADSINLFKSVSAKYDNTYSSLTSSSATSISNLTAQKQNYDNVVNYQNISSNNINSLLSTNYINYNNLYNTVCAQSAKNNIVKQYLDLSASNVGIDNEFQSQKFKYDYLYNFYSNSI